ncbi:very short patch repair endonuclease [Paracoccus angustae]|uniref:Very short patch repair endonuclease n=1 Tax=Paracoccus angustae TaxID=1671480 RepID=A0ABV7UAA8_9RHOB
MDKISSERRSENMRRIRSSNTGPEMAVRRELHAMGFRYSLHSKLFSGKPDMVFRKLQAVIFIHGCYWHGHDCGEVKPSSTNQEYWSPKIRGNRERDRRNLAAIEAEGWRHLIIWECAFRRKGIEALKETAMKAAEWLREGKASAEIGRSS